MTIAKVKLIKERLKAAQDRLKSYYDNRQRALEFDVSDKVFLKISPQKGVIHFQNRGKLSPCCIGPFPIIEWIRQVAYRLELSSGLERIHDVFHVSMLKKYMPDPSHILKTALMQLREDMNYEIQPVQILDLPDKVLRKKVIPMVKVLQKSDCVEEMTWEPEASLRQQYSLLFTDAGE